MKMFRLLVTPFLVSNIFAFETEGFSFSGNANIYYYTSDGGGNLFDKKISALDSSLNLSGKLELLRENDISISTEVGVTALSSLNMENSIVESAWGSAHTGNIDNAYWVNEAFVNVKVDKSLLKIGRMKLNTPMAFTEKWTIEKNTFESVLFENNDISETVSLIGIYIDRGNGLGSYGTTSSIVIDTAGPLLSSDAKFDTYGLSGAYAIGVKNNSLTPLNVQAWFYDLKDVASAIWLQADLDIGKLNLGSQYTGVNYDAGENSDAFAFRFGVSEERFFTP